MSPPPQTESYAMTVFGIIYMALIFAGVLSGLLQIVLGKGKSVYWCCFPSHQGELAEQGGEWDGRGVFALASCAVVHQTTHASGSCTVEMTCDSEVLFQSQLPFVGNHCCRGILLPLP